MTINQDVLQEIVDFCPTIGWQVQALDYSPIKGPEGNIEFLGHLSLDDVEGIRPDTAQVVADAHKTLN